MKTEIKTYETPEGKKVITKTINGVEKIIKTDFIYKYPVGNELSQNMKDNWLSKDNLIINKN